MVTSPAPPLLVVFMSKLLLLAGVVLSIVGAAFAVSEPSARAQSGACGTSHDSVDSEEQEFLGLIQGWRDSTLPVSTPLQTSGALNAAAAWYAQWQVENGTPGGHGDDLGRSWVQRALDCGYVGQTSGGTPYAFGSGEGTFGVASSGGVSLSPSQAVAGITYGGSGVYLWTPSVSLPAKCAGVGIYENEDGTAKAWIVLIAQYPSSVNCPGSTAQSPSPSPSATPTQTASPTTSPTPSPTATPRADGASVTLWNGWNLVTLPPGPVPEVLTRANGCFRAVYKQEGDAWLRYSPVVPAYANNLHATNGGTFWVEGTANCGLIQL